MNRFKKILVLCQENSHVKVAIERASRLASANGAEVTLLDIIDLDQREIAGLLSGLTDRTSHELRQQIHDYHHRRLENLAQNFLCNGLTVSTEVVHGVPFVETIRAVLRNGYDIIIKGANLDVATQRSIFLGLDLHLMRKCPCPVMIVNETPVSEHPRVLAAVDPDSENKNRHCVNRLILDLSGSLCAVPGSRLHVAHAWRIEEERALLTSGLIKANPKRLKEIRRKKRARQAQELKELLAQAKAVATRTNVHLLQGHAGDIVPKLASKLHIDLVVMGTVSRTDIGGLFIGSTAETIINRLNCSILAVKPPEFQTPVALDQPSERSEATHCTLTQAAA